MRVVAAVGIALTVLVDASIADAYPQFQLTSGTDSCSMCHYAPAGGGLLTGWGREESADTLSPGGDGAFLHGLVPLPGWLDLGGDVRFAGLINDTGSADGAELTAFPMQADLAIRAGTDDLAIIASLGLNGSARDAELQPGSDRREAGSLSYLVSREHYLYWRPKPFGPYLRAGRFYAPFGLRLPDHTSYVRRYTGFNLLEETYGIGGGWLKGNGEVHLTGFVSDRLRWSPRRELGGAAMAEWRAGDAVYGVSSRVGVGDADLRATGGLFYKRWLAGPKLLWMAEADATWQRFEGLPGAARWQLAAYAGPVWIPAQGVYASVAYELFDEDLEVRDVERHAVSAWISLLPRAHFELMLSGRAQLIGAADHALMTMLQLHYYL